MCTFSIIPLTFIDIFSKFAAFLLQFINNYEEIYCFFGRNSLVR